MIGTRTIKTKISATILVLNLLVGCVIHLAIPCAALAGDELRLDNFNVIQNGNTILGFGGLDAEEATRIPIAGLSGEKLKAVELDPATAGVANLTKFFGIGDRGNVFEIDITGATKLIGNIPQQFLGIPVDIDFDPETDDIAVVNNFGLMIKFNRNNPNNFKINEFLYDKNDPNTNKVGKGVFTLSKEGGFLLDVVNGVLAKLANPQLGLLQTVGALGLGNFTALGFDTNPLTNKSFASILSQGQTLPDLYEVDLTNGKMTKIGSLGGPFEGLTIAAPPLKDFHCVITPPDAINKVDSEHTVNVKVFVGSREILNPDSVIFQVLDGPNKGTEQISDSSTFTYSNFGDTGTDIIQAIVAEGADLASCTATKKWVRAPNIAAVDKNKKKLTVTGQFDTTADNRILVDGKEQATKTVSETELFSKKGGKKAKPDSVITVKSNGNPSNDFRVDQPPAGLKCVLMPLFATTEIKQGEEQQHNLTLQVFANGKLVSEELTVRLKIINGPNTFGDANKIGTGGAFTHTYTSNGKAGFDVIEASGTFKGGSFSCLAVKRWR